VTGVKQKSRLFIASWLRSGILRL